MSDNVDRVVIFPRYTPVIGSVAAADVVSAPMDARTYARVLLTGWQGTGFGVTPATLQFTIQQSPDLDVWIDGVAFPSVPVADSECSHTEDLNYPWIRVKAVLAGADLGITCWLVGEFVRREVPRDWEGA